MTERMVEIPVAKQTRDKIKKIKGVLTYDEFFRAMLDGKPSQT